MASQKFHEFVYEAENLLDEFLIIVLSFGAIFVTLKSLFASSGLTWSTWGKTIFEWIVMLGVMIIARELWLMNRKLTSYMEQEEEGE